MAEKEINVKIREPRAIEIVESIPEERFNEVIEGYIILGHTVVSYASITATKETVETFFAPLKADIDRITNLLGQIIPTIVTPAKKGAISVESIFKSFEEHFMDDSFEDVSERGKYTDIKATPARSAQEILIEVKDYADTVPSSEVDKFWRDMEMRNVRYGIFVSMRTRIAKISGDVNMITKMNRTAVFVVNEKLNWIGHLFAYHVIKKLVEHEVLMARKLKEEELTNVIAKVNNVLKKIQKDVKMVEEIRDVAEGLRTKATKELTRIIEIAKDIQRRVDEKIDEAFQEISRAKIEQ